MRALTAGIVNRCGLILHWPGNFEGAAREAHGAVRARRFQRTMRQGSAAHAAEMIPGRVVMSTGATNHDASCCRDHPK